VDILDGLSSHRPLREVYGYEPTWARLGPQIEQEITGIMAGEEIPEHSPTR
jgi:hypothetical protein